MVHRLRSAVFLGVAAALIACVPRRPRPIVFGAEPCAHCHMTIADPRFTAEAITTTGKVMVFDDVGCLATWVAAHQASLGSTWVGSFAERGRWLEASTAIYLRTDSLHTPMASGLAALRPGREADSVRSALGGALLTWSEVLETRVLDARPPS